MQTLSSNNTVERRWYVIDASDQSLGRLSSRVASVLRGKHRPEFTPHSDAGDFVIIINASKVKLTGGKLKKKIYYRHSGYTGGITAETAEHLLERRPDLMLDKAIKGMLPKGTLGRQMRTKLKVYADGTHPHAAQKPQPFPNFL